MNIDSINLQRTYGNSNSGLKNIKSKNEIQKRDNTNEKYSTNNITINESRILTNNERKFFVNMFPSNSQQIMTHEVFNSRGKVKEVNLGKGSIIDGRI